MAGLIIPVKGILPTIHKSCFIAENATITGDVQIGKDSSVWFQTVIRGDVNKIRIGERVNIQDGSMVHGSVGRGDTIIGNDVSVGHRAIIHGCVLKDNVLVGMGAIVLDDVVVNENVIVAAGAVVTSGQILESGYIYAGIPAKKLKPLEKGKSDVYIKLTSAGYVQYSQYYKE